MFLDIVFFMFYFFPTMIMRILYGKKGYELKKKYDGQERNFISFIWSFLGIAWVVMTIRSLNNTNLTDLIKWLVGLSYPVLTVVLAIIVRLLLRKELNAEETLLEDRYRRRYEAIKSASNNNQPSINENPSVLRSNVQMMEKDGWMCTCGRVNAAYTTLCACGRTKGEVQKTNRRETTVQPQMQASKSDVTQVNKNLNHYYAECVASFHNEAQKYNVARGGVVFVPELMTIGEKAVNAFYNRQSSTSPSGKSLYAIMTLCLEAGLAAGEKWHSDFQFLNRFVDTVIMSNPSEYATELLLEYFPKEISSEQGNTFYRKMYPVLTSILDPYWDEVDAEARIRISLLAVYQLGVSMILDIIQ